MGGTDKKKDCLQTDTEAPGPTRVGPVGATKGVVVGPETETTVRPVGVATGPETIPELGRGSGTGSYRKGDPQDRKDSRPVSTPETKPGNPFLPPLL